tara:strand:+ start:400 stop:615 length:216 start_codon:yes stop_codon:yes gene_type:complete
MTMKHTGSEGKLPSIIRLNGELAAIQRQAEIERAIHLQAMVRTAALKLSRAAHSVGALFDFTQRMNEKARL